MKALYMPMMDQYLILKFVKGVAMATKLFCCNEGKLILGAFFAVRQMEHGFVSPLLARGDTVAPSGLLARLCHAFLVILYAVLFYRKTLSVTLKRVNVFFEILARPRVEATIQQKKSRHPMHPRPRQKPRLNFCI